jgi:hypothetical protein
MEHRESRRLNRDAGTRNTACAIASGAARPPAWMHILETPAPLLIHHGVAPIQGSENSVFLKSANAMTIAENSRLNLCPKSCIDSDAFLIINFVNLKIK